MVLISTKAIYPPLRHLLPSSSFLTFESSQCTYHAIPEDTKLRGVEGEEEAGGEHSLQKLMLVQAFTLLVRHKIVSITVRQTNK